MLDSLAFDSINLNQDMLTELQLSHFVSTTLDMEQLKLMLTTCSNLTRLRLHLQGWITDELTSLPNTLPLKSLQLMSGIGEFFETLMTIISKSPRLETLVVITEFLEFTGIDIVEAINEYCPSLDFLWLQYYDRWSTFLSPHEFLRKRLHTREPNTRI